MKRWRVVFRDVNGNQVGEIRRWSRWAAEREVALFNWVAPSMPELIPGRPLFTTTIEQYDTKERRRK